MPKIAGKVLAIKTDQDGMFAKIQMNGKLPPIGTAITVKWGSTRSLSQNALLWVYYSWLINHGGLKEHGFFCPEALHYSLKSHFLSEKIMTKGQWKVIEEGTTTTLNKLEFGEYIEKIDSFVCDFFEISTAEFWRMYDETYRI